MKKLFFFLTLAVMLFATEVSAQQDTLSFYIDQLPSVVKSDTNFVLIVQSPFTTYKTTWKNLQRSMNFKKLYQTTFARMSDVIPITHTNTFDTTKGIKVSDFYKSALKDSVKGEIGIAKTSIESEIQDSVVKIQAQLSLKASIESVDSVKMRMQNAETLIQQKAGLYQLDNLRDSLYAELNLKASVTRIDTLKTRVITLENDTWNLFLRMNSAESGILQKANITDMSNMRDSIYAKLLLYATVTTVNTLNHNLDSAFANITIEATNRHYQDSLLTAMISLKVGVNDVYSMLQILPDSVKIQSKNIVLLGTTIADSLFGKSINGANIHTVTSDGFGEISISGNTITFEHPNGTSSNTYLTAGAYPGGRTYLSVPSLMVGETMLGSFSISTSGAIYMSNELVATQNWVRSLPAYSITTNEINIWNDVANSVFSIGLDASYFTTIYYKDQNGNNASMQVLTIP